MTYWCPSCDVYGRGRACWMCGDDRVIWGMGAPVHGGHRHDPEAMTTTLAGALYLIPPS